MKGKKEQEELNIFVNFTPMDREKVKQNHVKEIEKQPEQCPLFIGDSEKQCPLFRYALPDKRGDKKIRAITFQLKVMKEENELVVWVVMIREDFLLLCRRKVLILQMRDLKFF